MTYKYMHTRFHLEPKLAVINEQSLIYAFAENV